MAPNMKHNTDSRSTSPSSSKDDSDATAWEVAASPYWAVLQTNRLRPLLLQPVRSGSGATKSKRATSAIHSSYSTTSSSGGGIQQVDNEEEDNVEEDEEGFSPLVAFCFTINYILGTGFLTIPWAFVQSGLVLSTLVLLLSAIISDMAKDYLLETMARAEAMLDHDPKHMHWKKKSRRPQTPKMMRMTNNGGGSERSSGGKANPNAHMDDDNDDDLPRTPKHQHKRQLSCPDATISVDAALPSTQKNPFTDLEASLQEKDRLLLGKADSKRQLTTTNIAAVTDYGSLNMNGGHGVASPPSSSFKKSPRQLASPKKPIPTKHKEPVLTNNDKESDKNKSDLYLVKNRQFEVNTLCRIFIGKKGVAVYTVFISLYIIGLLWAYTSVFASAMSKAIPLLSSFFNNEYDEYDYVVYAILFGFVVVPLSCLELTEQVRLQVFMTACRFLMLGLMIWTTRHTDGWQQMDTTDDNDDHDVPLVHFGGLYKTVPILIVANMYHHSIPGLSRPVTDKTQLRTLFRWTSVCTSLAYSTIGIALGYFFGRHYIQPSVNLAWKQYHPTHTGLGGILINRFIPAYIVVFPALDVLSAFPLNAITLGNNMHGAYYGARVLQQDTVQNRQSKTTFRLLASIPPVLGGILVRDLGTITDYTGTTGFIIGFSIPALLYLTSTQTAQRKGYSTRTYYTSYASACKSLPGLVFWFGIAMVALVLTSLLMLQ